MSNPKKQRFDDLYRRAKHNARGAIVLFIQGGLAWAYEDDARILTDVLGVVSTWASSGVIAQRRAATLPVVGLERSIERLERRGHRVVVCRDVILDGMPGEEIRQPWQQGPAYLPSEAEIERQAAAILANLPREERERRHYTNTDEPASPIPGRVRGGAKSFHRNSVEKCLMAAPQKNESMFAAINRALACPECGSLCAIGQSGVVCLEGHGKIRTYAHLLKEFALDRFFSNRIHKKLCKMESVERQYAEINEVERLLWRERPNLVNEPRTSAEIAPPSPAASGTRAQPISSRVGRYEWKVRESIWNRAYGDRGENTSDGEE